MGKKCFFCLFFSFLLTGLHAQSNAMGEAPNWLRIQRDYKAVTARLLLWYQKHPASRTQLLYPGLSYFPLGGGHYALNFADLNQCSFGGLSSQIQVQVIADSSGSTLIKVKWPEEEAPASDFEHEALMLELERWLLLD
jgi:hypothetical protein